MNTKSGIFTRGFATRENTAFVVHSIKIKIDLTLKKSNILYVAKYVYHYNITRLFMKLINGISSE